MSVNKVYTMDETLAKILKIAGLGIGVFIAYIMIVFFATNSDVFSQENEPDQSKQSRPQQIANHGSSTEINVALEERMGLKFKHVNLCTPAAHKDEHFFKTVLVEKGQASTSCINGDCTVLIEFDKWDKIPEHVSMYLSDSSGRCKKTAVETSDSMDVLGYKATIEFTHELKKALGISSRQFTVDSSKSQGKFSTQMMGNKKTVLSYNNRPLSDQLMIDGKVKAKIVFQ